MPAPACPGAPGRSGPSVGYRITATAQFINDPPAAGHPDLYVSKRAARAKPHNLYAPPAQIGEVHHDMLDTDISPTASLLTDRSGIHHAGDARTASC